MPVIAEVPLPCRRPVRVEAPVPPSETARPVARVRTPALENELVAVAPKYALLNTERMVVEALENCWSPVHAFGFARLRDATTSPVVGEMVRVLSEFETEETATAPSPTQVPPMEKQPLVRFK